MRINFIYRQFTQLVEITKPKIREKCKNFITAYAVHRSILWMFHLLRADRKCAFPNSNCVRQSPVKLRHIFSASVKLCRDCIGIKNIAAEFRVLHWLGKLAPATSSFIFCVCFVNTVLDVFRDVPVCCHRIFYTYNNYSFYWKITYYR